MRSTADLAEHCSLEHCVVLADSPLYDRSESCRLRLHFRGRAAQQPQSRQALGEEFRLRVERQYRLERCQGQFTNTQRALERMTADFRDEIRPTHEQSRLRAAE